MAFKLSTEPMRSKVQRNPDQIVIDRIVEAAYRAGAPMDDTIREGELDGLVHLLKRAARFHGKRIVIETSATDEIETESLVKDGVTVQSIDHPMVVIRFAVSDRRKRRVIVEGVETDVDEDEDDNDDETSEAPPALKRGRGRSRKTEVVTEDVSEPANA